MLQKPDCRCGCTDIWCPNTTSEEFVALGVLLSVLFLVFALAAQSGAYSIC